MFVIKYKAFFFAISSILVLASIALITMWGLQPSVDFTGGAIAEVSFASTTPATADVVTALTTAGFENSLVRTTGEGKLNIRLRPLVEGDNDKLITALSTFGGVTIDRLSSVGPTVGQELKRKTVIAMILVILAIIMYIAFVFRHVSKPVSSWIYGLIAILALVHDVTIPAGAFALLGHYAGYEADTLFVVALLTILGLSVNDTIVVFDRIRENLRSAGDVRAPGRFGEIVGKSLEQTFVRSLNTSLTVILVLLVLFFLGGPTIHTFVLTLLVGMVVGTYSSIFIASPLLVVIGNRKIAKMGK